MEKFHPVASRSRIAGSQLGRKPNRVVGHRGNPSVRRTPGRRLRLFRRAREGNLSARVPNDGCPSESFFEWPQIYALGYLWVAMGGALLSASALHKPARRITPLEGKLLLERIERPLRKSD